MTRKQDFLHLYLFYRIFHSKRNLRQRFSSGHPERSQELPWSKCVQTGKISARWKISIWSKSLQLFRKFQSKTENFSTKLTIDENYKSWLAKLSWYDDIKKSPLEVHCRANNQVWDYKSSRQDWDSAFRWRHDGTGKIETQF